MNGTNLSIYVQQDPGKYADDVDPEWMQPLPLRFFVGLSTSKMSNVFDVRFDMPRRPSKNIGEVLYYLSRQEFMQVHGRMFEFVAFHSGRRLNDSKTFEEEGIQPSLESPLTPVELWIDIKNGCCARGGGGSTDFLIPT